MCGRVQQVETASEIAAYYSCDGPLPNMERRYNGAPGQDYLVVRYNPATGKRSVDVLQWGLVPHQEPDWAKARKHINARGETIHRFPAFKDSFEKRRCLLPVSHFFEWKGLKPPKQPYACAKRDHTPFALAAIWDAWKDPATGEWRRTFCIVTCEPNALMARIHDRMPVIVDPVNHGAWLGQSGASVDEVRKLLVPYPSELMTMWPIDQKMNTWKYNDPDTSDAIGDEEFADD